MNKTKTKPKLSSIGKRRLLKLADLLENKVNDNQFDLDLFYAEHNKKKTGCGTVGCALGWAAQSPKFRGLILEAVDRVWVEKLGRYVSSYNILDKQAGIDNIDAGETYFRLVDPDDVYYLFMPDSYPKNRQGRRSVIARIRKYVANNGDRNA